MKSSVIKLTVRSIKSFFGRYMAILLIVAISVGLFAGLRITQGAMIETGHQYLREQNFYDFRVFSTLGFTEEDVREMADADGVHLAEGSKSLDAMMDIEGNVLALKLMSLPEQVNRPSLRAGRMPEAEAECLGDDERFTEADIGKTILVSEENEERVSEGLAHKEYTLVGLVDSPLYLNMDRGSTDMGTGALHSFLYLPVENFTVDAYTEISLTLNETAYLYSEEYDELVESHKERITELTHRLAEARYEDLLAKIEVPPILAAMGVTAESLAEEMGLEKPETFVLTRNENAGYVNFENDTAIVSGIANIFPIFFILIAMLVCITTMTRMVDEERTQIGVLKAMGFGNGRVMAKYLLYAGSATVIGWTVGFFTCTWGLPQVFWFAYSAIYNFSPLCYLFSPSLALITLAIALIGILGATFLSCRKELLSVPATLIRPRAAKGGKRILLERVTPLWRRLPFLGKIITRNMFRYKQRLIMMLVGIGCCTALMVTAFGARDSMIHVGTLQYDDIQTYEIEATFEEGNAERVSEGLSALENVEDTLLSNVRRIDVMGDSPIHSVSLMSFDDTESLSDFWHFANDVGTVALPGRGEAIVSRKIAEKLSLSVGDSFTVRDADLNTFTVRVSGVFENYLYNYLVISEETYEDVYGPWEANTAMLAVTGDGEEMARRLTEMEAITGVSQLLTTENMVSEALSCLDYIILLVVAFSAALAFVVIFNLTNINLAERSREIATVQVLGFYPKETNGYVLRENLILSVIAALIGVPLGMLFHRMVMSMILIDLISFRCVIHPESYLLAVVATIFFVLIVNRFMRQIMKIKMAESLKAVE